MRTSLADLRNEITSAINGMSTEELGLHTEGKWSAAEILEHLNLTYLGTIKGLGRCLQSGQASATGSRLKNFAKRFGLIGLGYFPPGRKSPERVRPRGNPVEQVRAQVLENLMELEKVIANCEAKFGKGKAVADHPIMGPLTAPEWRKFHVVHGKHHVKQIVRLRRAELQAL